MKGLYIAIAISFVIVAMSCQSKTNVNVGKKPSLDPERYNVAFLIMDGVYNTELTAPYDIFQHTQYRQGIKSMNVFTVANTLDPIRTFEGLRILPDYDYSTEDLPHIDILVVPSAEHHLDTDLEDRGMIDWVRTVGESASYITSHCDGAFVLAEAGLLDDVASTTFPTDVDAYREGYPDLDIKEDVLFVHDGRAITSAGGARSFEAALYLCHHLYGPEITKSIARGLVIDWDISEVNYYNPDKIAEKKPISERSEVELRVKTPMFDKAILVM